ncbi:MAG: hypothetical protein LBN07_03825 [Christensenellaceae bacterium]|jgi:transcriptional regulator with XRE-family HTH domain|nr:hypothetical protein [Christensenellaceae bacterium]
MDKLLFSKINSYIDTNFESQAILFEMAKCYSCAEDEYKPLYSKQEEKSISFKRACAKEVYDYERIPIVLEDTFSQKLLSLIDKAGLSDPDVYKRAGIDRKLFSKIRSNKDYKPSKSTAIALALGLKLGLDDTLDLLKSAGFALSSSSKFDLIIKYFIEHKMFDIFQINEALHEFGEPVLSF